MEQKSAFSGCLDQREQGSGVVVRAVASHLCDPDSVRMVGVRVEFVVCSLPAPRVFSGFPPSIKTNTSNLQFDLDVKCLHMSPWLGRLGDYSLNYDVKFHLPLPFTKAKRTRFSNKESTHGEIESN